MDTLRKLSEIGTTGPNATSPFEIAWINRDEIERRAREMRAEETARLVRALSRRLASAVRAIAERARALRAPRRQRQFQ
jgi:hypothetical protein